MANFKSIYLIFLISSLFFTTLTSCKKYEEGPFLSIRSKTQRVANTWKIERATQKGRDITSEYIDERYTFTKSGDYTSTGDGFFDFPEKGKWALINNDEELQTVTEGIGGKTVRNFKILKLKESGMWLQIDDFEFHLVQA